MEEKSLLTRIGEAWDQHRQAQKERQITRVGEPSQQRFRYSFHWFLPTPGNVIFTLFVISSLLLAQNVGAISLGAPSAAATSITGIPYQGRLADKNGAPLTQTVNMTFRLYAAASGGALLWEEPWTGANSVQVSDGLFNVMLGSLTQIPQAVITGNNNLFLGITVGTDSEMSPRVQLGSVPFATQALTVPDGSITTAKIADGAVTSAKLNGASIPKILGKKSCNNCGSFGENAPVGDYVVKGANAQDPIQVTVTTSGAPLFVTVNTYVGPSPAVSASFCKVQILQGNSLVNEIIIDGLRATVSTLQCSGGYLLDNLPAGTYTFKSVVYVESVTTLTWDHKRQIVVFEY